MKPPSAKTPGFKYRGHLDNAPLTQKLPGPRYPDLWTRHLTWQQRDFADEIKLRLLRGEAVLGMWVGPCPHRSLGGRGAGEADRGAGCRLLAEDGLGHGGGARGRAGCP